MTCLLAMTTTLRDTLNRLALDFTRNVLQAIRSASLEDLERETKNASSFRGPRPTAKGPAARKGGRLARRSADDLSAVVDRIVALLEAHPDGLRAEEIRNELGLLPKELPRPIAGALADKRITKHGQRRATRYFARASSHQSGIPGKKRANGTV
jgi:hypothetical protein